jgi:uncharacterized protein
MFDVSAQVRTYEILVNVDPAPRSSSVVGQLLWSTLGLLCVGLGGIGAVVPGLPTTVFFIAAAACFTRSSPRLERWVLELPGIGPMVRDHRAGLGMPRRAKVLACSMIALFVTAAVVFAIEHNVIRSAVAAAGILGIAVVAWRVPTRERVLAGAIEAPP